MHKKTIAIVMDSYVRGGVALALQMFLQFLPKERYEITLFVRDYNTATMLPVPEGVVCRPWAEEAFSLGNRLGVLLNWRNFGKKAVYQARCRKPFPGEFDCVIGYQMVTNAVTVVALEKIRAKRKLLWLHGQKNFREQDLGFYDRLYAQADQIVCVSLDTENRFRQLMPMSADKALTIHNFYDIPHIRSQALAPAEDMDTVSAAVKIVSVGRLSKEKGFDRVPDVAKKLDAAGYDFRWHIIGDGDKRSEVETALRQRNLDDKVLLLGHRSNPFPYVQQCDIYVQPSYSEGFCTSTMEAKILYRPVVTTDVPGMREQFADGVNGLIVESSVDGIYEGIRRLIDSPELRMQIVENLHAEPISNDKALKQTMAVIDGTEE